MSTEMRAFNTLVCLVGILCLGILGVRVGGCGTPPDLPNAGKTFLYSGSAVKYTCNPGYYGEGNPYITCRKTPLYSVWTSVSYRCNKKGTWSSGTTGPSLAHQYVTENVITGLINDGGFIMSIDRSIFSVGSGTWSSGTTGPSLAHQYVTENVITGLINDGGFIMSIDRSIFSVGSDCGTPPAVSNARENYTSTIYGSKITYSCYTGYMASGTNILRCPSTGKWPTSSFQCIIKDCGNPPVLPNTRHYYSSTKYGSSVTYTCETGYTLAYGRSNIRCSSSGTWQRPLFVCSIKHCGTPPLLANGFRNYTATSYKSQTNYSCNTGFYEQGANSIICQSNGTWSSLQYTCHIKDCGNPPEIANGSKAYSKTTYNSTVTYSCNTGYNGVGTKYVSCEENGLWSPLVYSCHIRSCGMPPNVTNAVTTVKQTTYGSSARYTCKRGYQVSGVDIVTCDANGHWTPPALSCTKLHLKCHRGWAHFQDNCYTLGRYKETWIQAQAHCHALESSLAEMESAEEESFLRSYLRGMDSNSTDTGHKSYWLGASDMQLEGYWEWVHDGQQLNYTDFVPGQPDNVGNREHCLRMSGLHDYKWEDANCLENAYFICEKGLQQTGDVSSLFGK